mgnify:CR=1 FL=1
MPTFAQGSRSSLRYVVESTFGTTPTVDGSNPGIVLPFTSHSLNLSKDLVAGNERHGNKQSAGDIVADLRELDFDPFLESVMLNSWDTNVLKVGTAPKYFSIEDYSADIDQARLFTGQTVSTMGVSIAPNQMVTATFGMVGKGMSISATEFPNETVSSTNSPFDAYSGDLKIADAGSSLVSSSIITQIDFNVANSFAPTFVVGSDETPALEVGRAEVTGSFSAYFDNDALINRFLNETESAIEVSVQDPAANSLTFLFPRVKINSADVGVDGPTSRIINMSFTALFDTSEATNLKITRSS